MGGGQADRGRASEEGELGRVEGRLDPVDLDERGVDLGDHAVDGGVADERADARLVVVDSEEVRGLELVRVGEFRVVLALIEWLGPHVVSVAGFEVFIPAGLILYLFHLHLRCPDHPPARKFDLSRCDLAVIDRRNALLGQKALIEGAASLELGSVVAK